MNIIHHISMLHKNCENKMVARSLFSKKSKYIYFLTTCVVSFVLSMQGLWVWVGIFRRHFSKTLQDKLIDQYKYFLFQS